MTNKKIAIIGGGNLGSAIALGLISKGYSKAENITVTRRSTDKLGLLLEKGMHIHSNNAKAVRDSDIIVMAIKPHQVLQLLQTLSANFDTNRHILISVVTGVSIQEMQAYVPVDLPLFRAMPNTAIAIRESMTCIAVNNATNDQKALVLGLFEQVGKAILVNEEYMEAATVLGACGVAYSLRFIRAASQGGIEIGFDAQTAQIIAAQTVKGAASLLLEGGGHPEREIDKVTTPQGCTIAGLNEMEHQGFSSSLIKGIITSYKKIANIRK